jgi:ribosomal protein S18 acetylase RimI-like enzyme
MDDNKFCTVNLRNTYPSDKSKIVEFHHTAYKEMVLRQFGNWQIEVQNKFVEDDWNEGGIEIIVADGFDCGYVKTRLDNFVLYVIDFAIHPGFQRKGIGKKVVDILKSRAIHLNSTLRMDAFITNPDAQRFYELNGFKTIGKTDLHSLNEWKHP